MLVAEIGGNRHAVSAQRAAATGSRRAALARQHLGGRGDAAVGHLPPTRRRQRARPWSYVVELLPLNRQTPDAALLPAAPPHKNLGPAQQTNKQTTVSAHVRVERAIAALGSRGRVDRCFCPRACVLAVPSRGARPGHGEGRGPVLGRRGRGWEMDLLLEPDDGMRPRLAGSGFRKTGEASLTRS